MELAELISDWIKRKVEEARAKGVVVGLSGGLDSSVTAILCKMALPDNTLALIMPCFSSSADIKDAKFIANKHNIETKLIDLSHDFSSLLKTLDPLAHDRKANMAIANIKPRLRMITLYYFANKLNYLVVGTGNRSELSIGFFTKYGDGGVDILPLGNLLKTEVKELAKELGVPATIIKKVPSAGLLPGQTDEDEIGMKYEEIDRILSAIDSHDLTQCDPKKVAKIKYMIEKSRHKIESPTKFDVIPAYKHKHAKRYKNEE